MNSTRVSRGIQALIGGLMGEFAVGTLLARSTGPTGLVPAGSFAVPSSPAWAEEGSVFVSKNPARPDGAWPVTASPTPIPVKAMLGGPVGNGEVGAEYTWFPGLEGIEPIAVSDGIAGGEFDENLGALRQVNTYKNISSNPDFEQFFRAQLGDFPAASLAWESTHPIDGPNINTGQRTARVGQAKLKMRHTWILYLVSTRFDASALRRVEGEFLRDIVMGQLMGRVGTRGLKFAASPGINILSANVAQVTPTSYIDTIRFETTFIAEQLIADEENAKPWLSTRILRPIAPTPDNPTEQNLPDVTASMVPD